MGVYAGLRLVADEELHHFEKLNAAADNDYHKERRTPS